MNIEAYDSDSLRKLVRSLQYENTILREKLRKANIPFSDNNPFEETIEIVGMINSVLSKEVKKHFAMSVKIRSGRPLSYGELKNT